MTPNLKTVAKGVRVEIDDRTGEVYLVFLIVDEDFKRQVREEWEKDMPVKLINKKLVIDDYK